MLTKYPQQIKTLSSTPEGFTLCPGWLNWSSFQSNPTDRLYWWLLCACVPFTRTDIIKEQPNNKKHNIYYHLYRYTRTKPKWTETQKASALVSWLSLHWLRKKADKIYVWRHTEFTGYFRVSEQLFTSGRLCWNDTECNEQKLGK